MSLDTNTTLELEAVLPAQWFLPKARPLSPEQRLGLAILESAWEALHAGHKQRVEVTLWMSVVDWDSPFSFCNIIEMLNLGDPTAVRVGMFKKLKPRRIHSARGT